MTRSTSASTKHGIVCWGVILFSTLAMSACGGPLRVPPAAVATKIEIHDSHAGVCDLGVHLDRSGTSGGARPTDPRLECIQGYSNFFIPGAEPLPCWHVNAESFTGAVKWDLNDPVILATIDGGSHLVQANIAVFIRATNVPDNTGPTSVLQNARMVFATESWTPGVQRGRPDAPGIRIAHEPITTTSLRLPRTMPAEGVPSRVDVTDIVQRWLAGTLPNHGVVLTAEDHLGTDRGRPLEPIIGQHFNSTMTANYYLELELTFSR